VPSAESLEISVATGTIVLIIVIAVIVLALIGLAAWLGARKKKIQRHEQAESIRREATAEAGGIHESHVRAKEAEANAEQARLEAQRAEQEAARAHQGVSQERALQEERIREADRLDPNVDHKSDEYSPDTTPVETPPPAYDERGRVGSSTTGTTGATGATGTTPGTHPVDEHGRPVDEHGRPVEDPSEPGGTHRAP
jgi:FtsZ-interacting cell division protein ZipA